MVLRSLAVIAPIVVRVARPGVLWLLLLVLVMAAVVLIALCCLRAVILCCGVLTRVISREERLKASQVRSEFYSPLLIRLGRELLV